MYTIELINGSTTTVLHNNRLERSGNVCIKPELTTQLNAHGALKFDIAPKNPNYENVQRLKSYLVVKDDDVEIWRGRVCQTSKGLSNVKSIVCEGETAYLCDTIKRPFEFSGTPTQLLTLLLSNHNSQLPSNDRRRIQIGTVTVTGTINVSAKSAQTTWAAIKNHLLGQTGGYIRSRKSGSTVYLDYLADFTATSQQKIEYGKNLLSFSESVDATGVITRLIPYGDAKDKTPKLYKQSSGNTFVLHTGPIVAGKYLFVVNGTAMNGDLSGGKLGTTVVSVNGDTISTSATGALVWQISASTIDMSEEVSASGMVSNSITITNSQNESQTISQTITLGAGQNGLKIGGASGGKTGGSIQGLTQGGVSQAIPIYNEDGDQIDSVGINFNQAQVSLSLTSTQQEPTEWLVRNASSNSYLSTGTSGLALVSTATKQSVWKINNSENGANITAVKRSNDKEPSTLSGDMDTGFELVDNSLKSDPVSGEWDAGRITVKKVNSNSDTVVSTTGESIWGMRVWGTMTFQGVKTPSELLTKATAFLAQQIAEKLTLSVSAVDLSPIEFETPRFEVGVYHWVSSYLHDLNIRMLCRALTVCFDEPEKTKAVLGVGIKTLTDIQGGLIADVSNS